MRKMTKVNGALIVGALLFLAAGCMQLAPLVSKNDGHFILTVEGTNGIAIKSENPAEVGVGSHGLVGVIAAPAGKAEILEIKDSKVYINSKLVYIGQGNILVQYEVTASNKILTVNGAVIHYSLP
jgi:hypothetical protein